MSKFLIFSLCQLLYYSENSNPFCVYIDFSSLHKKQTNCFEDMCVPGHKRNVRLTIFAILNLNNT